MKRRIWFACLALLCSHSGVFFGGRAVGAVQKLPQAYIAQGFAFEQLKIAATMGDPTRALNQSDKSLATFTSPSVKATSTREQLSLEIAFLHAIRARALLALGRQSEGQAALDNAVKACIESGRRFCTSEKILEYSRRLLEVDWEATQEGAVRSSLKPH